MLAILLLYVSNRILILTQKGEVFLLRTSSCDLHTHAQSIVVHNGQVGETTYVSTDR